MSKSKSKWPHYNTLEELLDNTAIIWISDDGKTKRRIM